MKPIRKVMFPVAGLGTRFLPATKTTPKEMLPIVDKPLIQYAVEEAVAAGAENLVFITSRHKHSISDHFDTAFELESKLRDRGKKDLLRAVQDIMPERVSRSHVPQIEALGLGHAVLCGRHAVGDEPFGVILADDLIKSDAAGCLAQMVEVYNETGCSVLAVQEVDPRETDRYGIVATSPHGDRTERIDAIVEKPKPSEAPTNLAVVGRYILTPRIFKLLAETLPGAGGEIQLTDAIAALLKEETVLSYRFKGKRFDCGNKLGFVQASVEYALEHPDLETDFRDYLEALINRRVSSSA
ncbi:MAG: UTP--glucose-1-phosphate uridylyltransferase GalU [Xanthomonadales bacterium]|nr:UTP--glucose-1-phosphate uridylyltransferase GalU [Xanthomonadales bacterium]